MCELYERVEKEGIAKGLATGIAKGAQNILTLMQKLFAAGRIADAEKATRDTAYCSKLLAEFGLAN